MNDPNPEAPHSILQHFPRNYKLLAACSSRMAFYGMVLMIISGFHLSAAATPWVMGYFGLFFFLAIIAFLRKLDEPECKKAMVINTITLLVAVAFAIENLTSFRLNF